MSPSSWPKSSRYDISAARTSRSSSSFSSIVCTMRLSPRRRVVAATHRRAERDELEAVAAGDRDARRSPVDPDRPAAAHDEVDLLLIRVGVVVLATCDARRKREVVEAEGTRAERAADLPDGASRPFTLELVDVDVAVRHAESLRLLLLGACVELLEERLPQIVAGLGVLGHHRSRRRRRGLRDRLFMLARLPAPQAHAVTFGGLAAVPATSGRCRTSSPGSARSGLPRSRARALGVYRGDR